MKMWAPKAMVEPIDVNPMIKLYSTTMGWIQRLSENLKLAEITIVLALGSIKDECTFFTFAFMKDKL